MTQLLRRWWVGTGSPYHQQSGLQSRLIHVFLLKYLLSRISCISCNLVWWWWIARVSRAESSEKAGRAGVDFSQFKIAHLHKNFRIVQLLKRTIQARSLLSSQSELLRDVWQILKVGDDCHQKLIINCRWGSNFAGWTILDVIDPRLGQERQFVIFLHGRIPDHQKIHSPRTIICQLYSVERDSFRSLQPPTTAGSLKYLRPCVLDGFNRDELSLFKMMTSTSWMTPPTYQSSLFPLKLNDCRVFTCPRSLWQRHTKIRECHKPMSPSVTAVTENCWRWLRTHLWEPRGGAASGRLGRMHKPR